MSHWTWTPSRNPTQPGCPRLVEVVNTDRSSSSVRGGWIISSAYCFLIAFRKRVKKVRKVVSHGISLHNSTMVSQTSPRPNLRKHAKIFTWNGMDSTPPLLWLRHPIVGSKSRQIFKNIVWGTRNLFRNFYTHTHSVHVTCVCVCVCVCTTTLHV